MVKSLLTDVFFQANTIKGYRYLDDAGKIMNRWDSEFPNKEVGLQGLLMTNPTETMRQLRVDTSRIWMYFALPDGIRKAIELAKNMTSEICAIIGVEQFSRLGLRVQYVYGVPEPVKAVEQLANTILQRAWLDKVQKEELTTSFALMIPVGSRDMPVNMRIAVVKRIPTEKPSKDLPEEGILFDSDIYDTKRNYLNDLSRFMRMAQNWIEVEFPTMERILLGEEGND